MRASTIELYQEHEKLIMQRAWSWARLTNVPAEELISEAKIGFFESLEKWNSEKSKLSTWLYLTLNSRLQNFCHRYHEISPCRNEPDFEFKRPVTPGARKDEFKECILETLVADANVETVSDSERLSELVKAIPAEYKSITQKILREGRELSKQELTQILRKEGWKWTDIWKYYNEMKKILKNI